VISRVQAWKIVKDASARVGIQVLALRPSRHGEAGAPAPVHPHLFRHARVRPWGNSGPIRSHCASDMSLGYARRAGGASPGAGR
jgi:hypothetical protein